MHCSESSIQDRIVTSGSKVPTDLELRNSSTVVHDDIIIITDISLTQKLQKQHRVTEEYK